MTAQLSRRWFLARRFREYRRLFAVPLRLINEMEEYTRRPDLGKLLVNLLKVIGRGGVPTEKQKRQASPNKRRDVTWVLLEVLIAVIKNRDRAGAEVRSQNPNDFVRREFRVHVERDLVVVVPFEILDMVSGVTPRNVGDTEIGIDTKRKLVVRQSSGKVALSDADPAAVVVDRRGMLARRDLQREVEVGQRALKVHQGVPGASAVIVSALMAWIYQQGLVEIRQRPSCVPQRIPCGPAIMINRGGRVTRSELEGLIEILEGRGGVTQSLVGQSLVVVSLGVIGPQGDRVIEIRERRGGVSQGLPGETAVVGRFGVVRVQSERAVEVRKGGGRVTLEETGDTAIVESLGKVGLQSQSPIKVGGRGGGVTDCLIREAATIENFRHFMARRECLIQCVDRASMVAARLQLSGSFYML